MCTLSNAQLNLSYKVLISDEDFKNFEIYRKQNACLILKLHGSADAPESIQTTLRHIGKGKSDWHFAQHKGMALRRILQEYHLMVMGYSGSDDFDIVPVLTQTQSDKCILWVEFDAKKDISNAVLQSVGEMNPHIKSSTILSQIAQSNNPVPSIRLDGKVWKLLTNTPKLTSLLWPHEISPSDTNENIGTQVENMLRQDALQRYDNAVQQWHDASALFSELQNRQEAIRCAEQGRAIAIELKDDVALAEMSARLGSILSHTSDYSNALQYLSEAEHLAEKHNLFGIFSIVFTERSWIYKKTGNKHEAILYIQKAIALDKQLDNMDWLATDLNSLSTIISDDHPDKALEFHEEALRIARGQGNIESELVILNNGFLLFRGRMHPSKIVENLAYAEDLAVKTGNIRALIEIYGNQGMNHSELGDFPKALHHFQKAVAHATLINLEEGIAKWNSEIGDIYRKTGDYDKAARRLNTSLPILEKLQLKTEIGIVHGRLGLMYSALQEYPKAVHHLTKALQYDQEAGWTRGVVDDLGNLGLVHQYMGNYSTAMQYFEKAVDLARTTQYQPALARNLGNLGMELSRNNRHAEALKCDEEAMEINVQIGNREGEAYTRMNLAGDYFNAGRKREAVEQMKEALAAAQEIGLTNLVQHIRNVLRQLGIQH